MIGMLTIGLYFLAKEKQWALPKKEAKVKEVITVKGDLINGDVVEHYTSCETPKKLKFQNVEIEEIGENRVTFRTLNDSAWKVTQLDSTTMLVYKIGVRDPKTGDLIKD